MKVSSECIPCILRQVLRTTRIAAKGDEWLERKILHEIMAHLIDSSADITPAELTHECHRAAGKVLGMQDAYQQERQESIHAMQALETKLREHLNREEDKLYGAAVIATGLNAYDSVLEPSRNIELIIQMSLSDRFAHSDYEDFLEDLEKVKTILYVTSSSGELLGDKLFLEQFPLDKEITLVLRKAPIVTDASHEEAKMAGLETYKMVDPGIDIRGIPLEQVSVDFRELFEKTDLVVAKGQANYETLHSSGKECFYLLRTKCDYISGKLGVKLNNLVFLKE